MNRTVALTMSPDVYEQVREFLDDLAAKKKTALVTIDWRPWFPPTADGCADCTRDAPSKRNLRRAWFAFEEYMVALVVDDDHMKCAAAFCRFEDAPRRSVGQRVALSDLNNNIARRFTVPKDKIDLDPVSLLMYGLLHGLIDNAPHRLVHRIDKEWRRLERELIEPEIAARFAGVGAAHLARSNTYRDAEMSRLERKAAREARMEKLASIEAMMNPANTQQGNVVK